MHPYPYNQLYLQRTVSNESLVSINRNTKAFDREVAGWRLNFEMEQLEETTNKHKQNVRALGTQNDMYQAIVWRDVLACK